MADIDVTTDPPAPPAAEPPAASEPNPPATPPAEPPPASPEPQKDTSWRDRIQDQKLRDHIAQFTSEEDLARSHLQLRQKLSTAISVPSKDAGEEEWAKYRKQIGVPEGDYDWALPEGRDPTDEDKQFQTEVGKMFKGLNITAEQAKGLNGFWNEMTAAAAGAETKRQIDWLDTKDAELRKTWTGDDYDTNVSIADRSFNEWAKIAGIDEAEIDAFNNMRLEGGGVVGGLPHLRRMFAAIGRRVGESGGPMGMSTSEQQSLMEQFQDLTARSVAARNPQERDKLARQADAIAERLWPEPPTAA